MHWIGVVAIFFRSFNRVILMKNGEIIGLKINGWAEDAEYFFI